MSEVSPNEVTPADPAQRDAPCPIETVSAAARRAANADLGPLSVPAGMVAACVGMNKHKPPSEALEAMWRRARPLSHRQALDRAGASTEDERLMGLMARDDRVREVLDRSLLPDSQASDQVSRAASTSCAAVEALGLALDDRALVEGAVRRNMFTGYGIRYEAAVLQHLEDMWGIPAVLDSSTHRKALGTVKFEGEDTPWHLVGRVDALSPDGQTVIEVKNRVHRLFQCAPLYERVQLQAYLFLLDAPRGMLVECLRTGEPPEVTSNVIRLDRDRAFWDKRVAPRLAQFVAFFAELLDSPDLQDEFFRRQTPHSRAALIFGTDEW